MRYASALLLALLLAACAPTQQARQEYVQAHDRPPRIEEAIMEGQVVTGMTKDDVRASWGDPQHVNDSFYEGVGSQTQWCYGQYSSECVYFEGGTVTGWN